MTLTEFLNARIAEDEAVARAERDAAEPEVFEGTWLGPRDEYEGLTSPLLFTGKSRDVVYMSTARVLAECAAKRAIVEEHPRRVYLGGDRVYFGPYVSGKPRESKWVPDPSKDWDFCGNCFELYDYSYSEGELVEWPCPTLRTLAAVYADHPDYDESWAL